MFFDFRKNSRPSLSLLVVALALTGVGLIGSPAQAAFDYSYSGDITFTSDYIWRGASQTRQKPAVQGGYSLDTNVGLSVGLWGSNIAFDGSQASLELDTFINGSFTAGRGIDVQVGYLDYHYPGDSSLNFAEIFIGIAGHGFSFDAASSNDYEGSGSEALWYQIAYEYELVPSALNFGFSYGRVSAGDKIFIDEEKPENNRSGFNHSTAYLATRFETFELKGLFSTSNRAGCSDLCDQVTSLSLTKSF